MSEMIRRPSRPPAANVRIEPSREPYDGADLRPPPGIEPTRLVAFTLPSRVGDRLYYPDGQVKHIYAAQDK